MPESNGVEDIGVSLSDQNKSSIDPSAFPPSWAFCVSCKAAPKSPDTVFLACLHICCSEDCLNKLVDQGGANPFCPECYMRIDRNLVHPGTYLNDKLETLKDGEKSKNKASHENQICKSCVRDAEAHRWCMECREFLCEFCCEYHQYSKATKGHALVPTSEGMVELNDESGTKDSARKCQLHSDQDLIFFCLDCEKALCSSCLSSHTNHKFKSLQDFAIDMKKKYMSGHAHVQFVQEKCEEAARLLEQKLQLVLNDQKAYLYNEARACFKRLIDALLQREIQVRKDLVETVLAKVKELNIKKAKTLSVETQCKQLSTIVRDIVEKGTAWHVVNDNQHIENQFKNLEDMYERLKDEKSFDAYVEKNYSFHFESKPADLAEKCIQLICQARYRDPTQPDEKSESKGEEKQASMEVDDVTESDTSGSRTSQEAAMPKVGESDEKSSNSKEPSKPAQITAAQRESRGIFIDTKSQEESKILKEGGPAVEQPAREGRSRRRVCPARLVEEDAPVSRRSRSSTSRSRASTRSCSQVRDKDNASRKAKVDTAPVAMTPRPARPRRARSVAMEPERPAESSPEGDENAGRGHRQQAAARRASVATIPPVTTAKPRRRSASCSQKR